MSYLRESKYLVFVLPFHYIPQKLRGHLGISNVYHVLRSPQGPKKMLSRLCSLKFAQQGKPDAPIIGPFELY
jgi:hypothetical protein